MMARREGIEDLERRLRAETPGPVRVGPAFFERLSVRLDAQERAVVAPGRVRGIAVIGGGLAAAVLAGAVLVWSPAREPSGADASEAMVDALRLSAVERPREFASAAGRGATRLAAERDNLVADARGLHRRLFAPVRSVVGRGGS